MERRPARALRSTLRGGRGWNRATSPSRTTASSATCARPRWWGWTAPSTGSACRTSIPRASSPPSWTTSKGGRFRIAPAGDDFRRKQFYWPDTAILVTRFLHDDGVGEVEDYMPVGGTGAVPDELIRRVRVVRGQVALSSGVPARLRLRPRRPPGPPRGAHGARFDGPGLSLGLAAPVPLRPDGDGVVADFTLGEGEKATFVLRRLDSRGRSPAAAPASARRKSCSATPSPTGGAGSRSAPTPAAGGRWSTARP